MSLSNEVQEGIEIMWSENKKRVCLRQLLSKEGVERE
jgi:hypothetical protein